MKINDISKQVRLICPICGNDQFLSLDLPIEELKDASETSRIQCSDCHRIFTKEELLTENQERIDSEVKEIKDEVTKQIHEDIKKALRKLR